MNGRYLLISSLVAGVPMGLLSSLPIVCYGNLCIFLWLWSFGAVAVWIYVRQAGGGVSMTANQGAIIGAAAGLMGIVASLFTWAILGVILEVLGLSYNLLSGAEAIGDLGGGLTTSFGVWMLVVCASPLFLIFGATGGRLGREVFGRPITQV